MVPNYLKKKKNFYILLNGINFILTLAKTDNLKSINNIKKQLKEQMNGL